MTSRSTVLTVLIPLLLAGCEHGGLIPVRETYPKVQVKTVKTWFGVANELLLTSDFRGEAEGKWNKDTKEFEFKVIVDSKVSTVLPGYTEWSERAWLPSQEKFNHWSEIQWEGAKSIVKMALDFGAPLFSQYLMNMREIEMAAAIKPDLLTQAIGLFGASKSGQFPIDPTFLWNLIGPKLQAAISRVAPNVIPGGGQPVSVVPANTH